MPTQRTDLADCTASELLRLYRSRQASPVEAVQAVHDRIERPQPGAGRVLPSSRRTGRSMPRAPARRAG